MEEAVRIYIAEVVVALEKLHSVSVARAVEVFNSFHTN